MLISLQKRVVIINGSLFLFSYLPCQSFLDLLIINSINYLDGINGLSSGLFLFTLFNLFILLIWWVLGVVLCLFF
ncbi:MAG TPA: hypothetical protein EYO86_01555 [Pelagibacterales bacterium]|nr:hypothetical protein [Pelagibacterales bacterium]